MEYFRFTVTALKSFLSGFFVCNLLVILILFIFWYVGSPFLQYTDTVLWTWGIFAVLGYVFDGGFRSVRADIGNGVIQLRYGLGPISFPVNVASLKEVELFLNHLVFQRGTGIDSYDGYVNKLGYVKKDGTPYTLLAVDKKKGIMIQYFLTQILQRYRGAQGDWSTNFVKLRDFFRRNSRRHSLTVVILVIVILTCWFVLGSI